MAFLKQGAVIGILLVVFIGMHWAGITYGTGELPLHQGYVGDEQSPVNAAFHALNQKSLLGFRNNPNLYYGPLFATIAIPPVAADFVMKRLSGVVHSAEDYKAAVLWDWSGVEINIRIVATFFGFVATYFWFLIMREWFSRQWMALAATGAFALNYFVFEYVHFFKHWVFVLTSIVISLWALQAIHAHTERKARLYYWAWAYAAALLAFGVSYVSGIYQIAFLPFCIAWLVRRRWDVLMECVVYGVVYVLSAAALVLWHPYAFMRLLEGRAFVMMTEHAMPAFQYYLHLLAWNHVLLLIGALVLVVALWKRLREYLTNDLIMSAAVLVGAVNFLLFAIQPRAEGRYMLPTILAMLLVSIYLVARQLRDGERVGWRRVAGAVGIMCIVLNGGMHAMNVLRWNLVYAKGHPEQQLVAAQIAWEQEHPDKKTFMITPYLLGHAHTKDAYRDYAEKTYKTDVNLYQELLATPAPERVEELDVYYGVPDRKVISDTALHDYFLDHDQLRRDADAQQDAYDRVIVHFMPRSEPNYFDYIDFNMWRIWNFDDHFGRYEILYEK